MISVFGNYGLYSYQLFNLVEKIVSHIIPMKKLEYYYYYIILLYYSTNISTKNYVAYLNECERVINELLIYIIIIP